MEYCGLSHSHWTCCRAIPGIKYLQQDLQQRCCGRTCIRSKDKSYAQSRPEPVLSGEPQSCTNIAGITGRVATLTAKMMNITSSLDDSEINDYIYKGPVRPALISRQDWWFFTARLRTPLLKLHLRDCLGCSLSFRCMPLTKMCVGAEYAHTMGCWRLGLWEREKYDRYKGDYLALANRGACLVCWLCRARAFVF
jgi:hypothetical protein